MLGPMNTRPNAPIHIILLNLCAGALLLAAFSGCATTGPKGLQKSAGDVDIVQLQIFLDAQKFGPGVIDGHRGEFTDKALAFYREKHGNVPDLSATVPYTYYVITEKAAKMIGPMAKEPADLAKQSRLPFVSLGELVAEKFHTTESFLHHLNPRTDLAQLTVGTTLKVPNVARPFDTSSFPSSYSANRGPSPASRHIIVDTQTRMLQVRDGGTLVAAFPITPGSSEHPAPVGDWRVVRAVPWPWYRYDEGILKRGERTETFYNFPPGPNSPVGVLWTGLNRPSVGIHGTAFPDTIGRAGSHGCIRLANWDAATFYTLIGPKMAVTIR